MLVVRAMPKSKRKIRTSCLKVEMVGRTDLYALLVETDGALSFRSTIHVYRDFPGPEPVVVVSMLEWVVDFTVLADGAVVAVTADGKTLVHPSGELEARSEGPLRSVSSDEQRRVAVAVGDAGSVHLWTEEAWRNLGAPGPEDLHAAAVARDGTVFVGGRAGALYRWSDSAWARLSLGTSATIEALASGPDGALLVGGAGGALFVSRDGGGSFESVEGAGGDIKGACFHRGQFVVAGPGFSLVAVDGAAVVPFKTGRQPYKITAHGDWILGAEDDAILYFTGEGWFRMPIA